MNISERILSYPANEVIEFRGDDMRDFIASIGNDQITPSGDKLKDFLDREQPSLIRGEPCNQALFDEEVRSCFGSVMSRDWYYYK